MITEVGQKFWAAMARGEFLTDAAAEAGTYRVMGARWLRAEGGVRPRRGRDLKGRCLTFAEREEPVRKASLEVKMTTSGPVVVGQPVTVTITVINHGPDLAWDVRLFLAVSPPASPSSVIPASTVCGATDDGGHTSCQLGDMPPGVQATTIVAFRPKGTATCLCRRVGILKHSPHHLC
jgi:hypothetical protein